MFTDTKVFSAYAVDNLVSGRAGVLRRDARGPGFEEHGLLTLHLAGGRDTRVDPKSDHTADTYTDPHVPGGRTARPRSAS